MKSTPAGPKPKTICKDNFCDNYYTVRYWKNLEEAPGKNVWIGKKIDKCLKEANVNIDWNGLSKNSRTSKIFEYIEVRTPFIKKINDAVNQGKFSDNENLQQAIDRTILCDDVVHQAELFKD